VSDNRFVEKRRRNGIALGILAAFLLVAVSPSLLHWREPGYEGEKISYWLRQIRIPGQERAARAALKHIGPDALPWILPMLRAKDSKFKIKLEEWADRQPLIELQFKHANEEWFRGVQAIQILGPQAKAAIPELSRMLKDPDVATFVAQALAGIGPEGLPPLVQALTNQNATIRSAALLGLSELGTNAEPVLSVIIAAVQDTNASVWHAALEAVVRAGENRPDLTLPVLLSSLETGDAVSRGAAIQALAAIGTNQSAQVVPVLMKGLEDPDARVRFNAALALGRFKTAARPAAPRLIELLRDTKTRGGGALARALMEIIGVEAVLPISQAITNRPPPAQIRMIRMLADFGGDAEAALPALIELAQAEDGQVRLTAIDALGRIRRRPELVVPRLIERLAAEDYETQLAAATALGCFGSDAQPAVPVLLELVRKENASDSRGAGRGVEADDALGARRHGLTIPPGPGNSGEFVPFLSFAAALKQIDPEAARKAGVK
jgi:HEAT repeat protein